MSFWVIFIRFVSVGRRGAIDSINLSVVFSIICLNFRSGLIDLFSWDSNRIKHGAFRWFLIDCSIWIGENVPHFQLFLPIRKIIIFNVMWMAICVTMRNLSPSFWTGRRDLAFIGNYIFFSYFILFSNNGEESNDSFKRETNLWW